jgi:hypothetical protein
VGKSRPGAGRAKDAFVSFVVTVTGLSRDGAVIHTLPESVCRVSDLDRFR